MARKHTVLKKRMSLRGNIKFLRAVCHGEEICSSLWFPRLLGHWGVCYLHSSFFLQLFNDFINTWHASLYRGMLYRSTFCYRSLTHKMAADLRSWFLLLQFCISMYQLFQLVLIWSSFKANVSSICISISGLLGCSSIYRKISNL